MTSLHLYIVWSFAYVNDVVHLENMQFAGKRARIHLQKPVVVHINIY